MQRLGLSLQTVKAVFISHEHTDHITGLQLLAKRYNLPVYITKATARRGRFHLQGHPVHPFRCSEPIAIGSLTITPFSKAHDAADPHSFVVSCSGIKVGIFTDIGTPCTHLIRHFSECHAAFLEANYDEQMLASGSYPAFLKNRIRGGNGHLSNTQALALFTTHKPAHMTHLLLAHLSKNNNCPKLVQELFGAHARGTEIVVASRYKETPLYHIQSATRTTTPHYFVAASQLTFSF
jgi:phosphoribosyl 1,2-cyclic phosphodiesterase